MRKSSRLELYLYSTKNLVGCALALVGLLLFFTGAIGAVWPIVVLGGYAVGALAAPPRPALQLAAAFNAGDIARSLDQQRRSIVGKVPDDIMAQVDQIQTTIKGILPRSGALTASSPEAFIVERTAKDYLPTALESYIALPPAYAATRKNADGKTAKQMLSDQLTLLSSKLGEIADAVSEDDVDRLAANGKFLEDRFGRSALDLPAAPQPSSPDDKGTSS